MALPPKDVLHRLLPLGYLDEAHELLQLRLHALVEQLKVSTRGNFLAILVVCLLLWGNVDHFEILIWASVVTAILAGRLWLIQKRVAVLHRSGEGREGVIRAFHLTMALSVLLGVVSASVSYRYAQSLDLLTHAYVLIVWVAAAAGSAVISGSFPPNYIAYSLSLFAPVILATLVQAHDHFVVAIVGMAAFLVVLYQYTRRSELLFLQSFEMQQHNSDLLIKLRQEQQVARQALVQAEQANAAKTRFLAAASHDLRQPLSALAMNSAAFAAKAQDEVSRTFAARFEQSVESLTSYLNEVLDMSQLDAHSWQPKPCPVPLSDLLHRIAEDLRPEAEGKGIALRVSCDSATWAHTDPAMLERILRNLMGNAVRYTERGEVSVDADPLGDTVRVRIADTGIGIAPQEHERVFDAFYQIANRARNRTKGLGLGLAIVRRLAELQQIPLRLQSELGIGTTLTLTLPRTVAPAAGPAAEGAGEVATARVLVIDDEDQVREGLVAVLESAGYVVDAVADGREAQRVASVHRPDVIVADLMLEDSLGSLVVANLHRQFGPIPALILTGDSTPERLQEAQALGFPIACKPLSGRQLVALIERLR